MKKKFIIITAVVLLMTAFFIGCSKMDGDSEKRVETEIVSATETESKPMATPAPNEATVGLITFGDGYEALLLENAVNSLASISSIKINVHTTVANEINQAAALEELISSGCEIIFSFGIESNIINEAASANETIYFQMYDTANEAEFDNISSFHLRIYQQQFLNGMVAGYMSDTGKIGYLSEQAENTDIRRVNAFALGAKAANSEAAVHFAWAETDSEQEAIANLAQEGCDIVFSQIVSENMLDASISAGITMMGKSYESQENIVPIIEPKLFGYVFSKVQSVSTGTYVTNDFFKSWISIGNDEIKLDKYNMLAQEQKNAILEYAASMQKGEWDVFTGPISDAYGQTIVPDGMKLPDEDLLYMLWYVANVRAMSPPMG